MGSFLTLILLYLGFSLSSCSHFPLRTYHYVDLPLTWANAQNYCRENYTDLATIESQDDVSRLPPSVPDEWAWIGLNDDPKSWRESMGNDLNSWRWSATGETSKTGYSNWDADRPMGKQTTKNCVVMLANGKWSDWQCPGANKLSFICYTVTDGNEKTYVYISANKGWKSARAYCREHHTDLPMIENQEEQDEIFATKPANSSVWIGLYRMRWTWSDGSQSSFRSWRSTSPDSNDGSQLCVAKNGLHEWNDDICGVEFPFICHQVSKLKTRLRMTIQTDADLTDPATNAQLLQKLDAELRSQGYTDFKLRWTIQPRKQEEDKHAEPQCNLHL